MADHRQHQSQHQQGQRPPLTASEARSALAPMVALVRRFMRLDEVLVAVEVAEGRLAGLTQRLMDAEAALANCEKRHTEALAAHAAWQDAMGRERTALQQAMAQDTAHVPDAEPSIPHEGRA